MSWILSRAVFCPLNRPARSFLFLLAGLFALSSCLTYQKNARKSEEHHKIAVSLIGDCDKPRALSHAIKAVKLKPKDFLARHTLATIYYLMGRRDKALKEYQKALKIKSDFTEARVNLARVYIDIHQEDLALKELKKAERDMTYAKVLKIMGLKSLAYYNKGDYLSSKKWLDKSFAFPNGKSCFVYLNLGKTELALGNLKKAERVLKKSLALCRAEKPVCAQPSYEGHLALARLYIKKGDKGRAKYHLNLFLRQTQKGPEADKAKKLLKEIS